MRNKAEQRSRPNPENPRGKETQFEYGPLVLTKDDVRKRFQRANLAIEASSTLGKLALLLLNLTKDLYRRVHA